MHDDNGRKWPLAGGFQESHARRCQFGGCFGVGGKRQILRQHCGTISGISRPNGRLRCGFVLCEGIARQTNHRESKQKRSHDGEHGYRS
jgi:hypothetical protein